MMLRDDGQDPVARGGHDRRAHQDVANRHDLFRGRKLGGQRLSCRRSTRPRAGSAPQPRDPNCPAPRRMRRSHRGHWRRAFEARGARHGPDGRPAGRRIQYAAASDRDRRRIASQDEPIAARQHRVALEPQTCIRRLAGRNSGDRRPARRRLTQAPRDRAPRRCRDETARARRGAAACASGSSWTTASKRRVRSNAPGASACRRAARRPRRRRPG